MDFFIRGKQPWKLNVGCGMNRLDGFVNVDKEVTAKADELWDIEQPWPVASGSVDEISANHVMEHLRDLKTFIQEAYRVMVPGGKFEIAVPHHCSNNFWGDPTHVRPITFEMLTLLSRACCDEWVRRGNANSPLAIYWDIDFVVESMQVGLQEHWKSKFKTDEEVKEALLTYNNVADEVRFVLKRV